VEYNSGSNRARVYKLDEREVRADLKLQAQLLPELYNKRSNY